MTSALRLAVNGVWCGSFLGLSACSSLGPAALTAGRPAYNEVINQTEDQQILSMIVRQRYDETFGMLAVSSVTANLQFQASAGGNVGIGPDSSFEGNLVPLSAGVVYEDNPTISYTPMRGEQFLQRMLAPLSAEHALLLARLTTDEVEVLRLLIRRANGLVNPIYTSRPVSVADAAAFDRFIDLYARLREAGRLDVVRSSDERYDLYLHDYTQAEAPEVEEMLGLIGVQQGPDPIIIPTRFFVGARDGDSLDFETPSPLEMIRAIGIGVHVPEPHRAAGLARPLTGPAVRDFITIRSSPSRPASALTAVAHHGWWFYIDATDARSKQGFTMLRALIGLRLDSPATEQAAPILTVPVR